MSLTSPFPSSSVSRIGQLLALCGAAMLLLSTGWVVGTRQAHQHVGLEAADLDQFEARIHLLEYAARQDVSAEQFRAARAMILDLGREIDALRGEAKIRDSRVQQRLDRVERQTSDATPAATIPVAPLDRAPGTVVPPPAPALPAHAATSAAGDALAVTEIYRQQAIVEGANGLWRVAVGDDLPGYGRVEAIEQRGKGWAVVTAKGTITSRTE